MPAPFNPVRCNLPFQIYANWMNLIVNILFPVILMTTLNVRIYRAMRKFHKVPERQQQQHQQQQHPQTR